MGSSQSLYAKQIGISPQATISTVSVQRLWDLHDSKKIGKLNHKEARNFLKDLAGALKVKYSSREADSIIQEYINETGWFDYSSFFRVVGIVTLKAEASLTDSLQEEVSRLELDGSDTTEATSPKPKPAKSLPVSADFHTKLSNAFLSPKCCTDSAKQAASLSSPLLTDEQIREIMLSSVDGVGIMLDRTRSVPVLDFITSTYQSGLPVYDKMKDVQEQIKFEIRFIFQQMSEASLPKRKLFLSRLAEAYQHCQAVQARVIDNLFGEICGRDMSLRDQILSMVDVVKQRTLDQVTMKMNLKKNSHAPSEQIPHIQSAYKSAIGGKMGLRGTKAASADRFAPRLSSSVITKLEHTFRKTFDVKEVIDDIMGDVNQTDPNAERYISLDLLAKWAGDSNGNNGFDSHSIYYNEDNKDTYPSEPSQDQNDMMVPFLSTPVTESILRCMFLSDK